MSDRKAYLEIEDAIRKMRDLERTAMVLMGEFIMANYLSPDLRVAIGNAITDAILDLEDKARRDRQSLFDRIGSPEERSDPRPVATKSGAHFLYR